MEFLIVKSLDLDERKIEELEKRKKELKMVIEF